MTEEGALAAAEVRERVGVPATAGLPVATKGDAVLEADKLTLWVFVASRRIGVEEAFAADSVE
jgi:hypothetical protein